MKSTALEGKNRGEVMGAGFVWLCFLPFKAVIISCFVYFLLPSFLPVHVLPSTNLPFKCLL